MSPTARTLKWLRDQQYHPWTVERFNTFSKKRLDLFNAFDLVALHPHQHGLLGIQVTSRSNASSRRTKLCQNPLVALWLQSGNPAHLHTWGKVKGRWGVYRERVFVDELDGTLKTERLFDE